MAFYEARLARYYLWDTLRAPFFHNYILKTRKVYIVWEIESLIPEEKSLCLYFCHIFKSIFFLLVSLVLYFVSTCIVLSGVKHAK